MLAADKNGVSQSISIKRTQTNQHHESEKNTNFLWPFTYLISRARPEISVDVAKRVTVMFLKREHFAGRLYPNIREVPGSRQ